VNWTCNYDGRKLNVKKPSSIAVTSKIQKSVRNGRNKPKVVSKAGGTGSVETSGSASRAIDG